MMYAQPLVLVMSCSSSRGQTQIDTRHCCRFCQSHDTENRRRYVTEGSSLVQGAMERVITEDKWDRVEGMGRVWSVGDRINHLLRIAVIRRDDSPAAEVLHRLD